MRRYQFVFDYRTRMFATSPSHPSHRSTAPIEQDEHSLAGVTHDGQIERRVLQPTAEVLQVPLVICE